MPERSFIKYRFKKDVTFRNFVCIFRFCYFKRLFIGIVDRFDGNSFFVTVNPGGRIVYSVNGKSGDFPEPHKSGKISSVILAHMVAVTGSGIAQERSSGILHRRSGRNDEIHILISQDFVLGRRNDGIIHGHLIAVIPGELLVSRILLICPGHVPADFRLRTLFYITDQIVQVIVIGTFNTACCAPLLKRDIVPIPLRKSSADFCA